ncbi:MAG: B12-binding domain-containing radical SAM protein [Candidatus Hodarchaeota archaeon]
MKKNKLLIYLAELVHNGFGLSLNTVPLGIGCVGAYSKKIYGDEIELRLFRQIDDLMSALLDRPPHIIGFGYFTWNDNLTLVASAMTREVSPDSLIVLGGLNISFDGWENFDNHLGAVNSRERKLCTQSAREYDLALLRNHQDVDIIVHGDGEVPFSNIVKRFMNSSYRLKAKREPIDGSTTLVDGQLLTGNPVTPLSDLDVVPSPYLMGLFAEFLGRFQLIPQIETARGCPYECTYCTIGGNTNRIRKHSLNRIKEEILFLKDNSPNRILRIADANWGILKKDVELAEFIRELHDTSGYPSSLRVYYAEKGPFENVKKMANILKTLLPLNMSFQTLTKEVLNNVKRKNMPITKVREMVTFAHNNGISVSTELISGLPGETYQSFRKVFLELVKLNFDSVYVQSLYLIKGSELYTDIARKLYRYNTMYSLIGKDVTKVDSRYVFEADEVVVESHTMSREDFWELHKFNLFIYLCYGSAFLKEIVMHCMNYNITPLDIYDELFRAPDRYSFLNTMFAKHMTTVKMKYFTTQEELERAITESIAKYGNVDEFSTHRQLFYSLGTLLSSEYKDLVISDFGNAAHSIYDNENQNDHREFHSILDILNNLASDVIIPPLEEIEEEVVRQFKYDLVAWARDGYRRPLSKYSLNKSTDFSLYVRNIDEHRDLLTMAKGSNAAERYEFYFSTVVSSNMRRFIKYADR